MSDPARLPLAHEAMQGDWRGMDGTLAYMSGLDAVEFRYRGDPVGRVERAPDGPGFRWHLVGGGDGTGATFEVAARGLEYAWTVARARAYRDGESA